MSFKAGHCGIHPTATSSQSSVSGFPGECSDCCHMQEKMGTLPAVELLCQALTEQEGILETRPGRRLQGTAFAPEIQVSNAGHA